jgi:acetyl esterase
LLILAEVDPLFQEGVAYAERLRTAGVPVERKVFAGMFHGFWWTAGVLDDARRAIDAAAEWIREATR